MKLQSCLLPLILGSSLSLACSQDPAAPIAGDAGSSASGGAGAAATPLLSAGSGSAGKAGSPAAEGGKSGVAAAGSGGMAGAGGSAGGPPPANGPSPGEGSVSMDGSTLKAQIVIKQAASGEEQHQCVVVELPNADPVWVTALHAQLSDGTHHLIVDRRAASDALMTSSQVCSPTMAGDQTRLLIAQQHDTLLALPSGVAYRLEAHQRIFLQLHYINLKEQAEVITGSVELTTAPASSTLKEARSLFAGATSISLPAHQMGMASYFAKPAGGTQTRHVFAVTSHTHSLGIRSTIERVASADAAESTPLHESLNWAEPPLTMLSPMLDFTGKDGLRLICRYMNTTDHAVSFGTRAEDEMCFMWMYYYDE
jgi:hypothetical protein